MPGAQGELEVALRGVRRQAGARAGALAERHDDGQLGLTGLAEALGHQAEAAARGTDGGALAGVRVPERHHHRRDLALGLHDLELEARRLPGEEVEQAAGRRHGIRGVGPEAAADESEPGGLETGHDRSRPAAGQVDEQLLRGQVVAAPRHREVQLRHLRLIPHDHVLERAPRDGDRLAESPQDRRVAQHRRRSLLGKDGLHRDTRAEGMHDGGQPARLDRLAVVHGDRALLETPLMLVEGLLGERDQHVDVVPLSGDATAMGAHQHEVVAATDERG